MSMLKYRHIEVFYAVMTHGTVTAAAEQLGVTQPTATATLKNAEAALGFDLFHRVGGRLVPTREATILLSEVQRAHSALEAIGILAGKLKEGVTGHLRIAATPVISLEVLPEAVARFSRTAARYSYEVTSQHSNDILKDLQDSSGRYHLGLTFGINQYTNLGQHQVGHAHLFCLMPREWALENSKSFDLGVLSDVPTIATFEDDPLGQAVQRLLTERQINPDVVAKVHAHQVAAALVAESVGAVILDALTVRHAMSGALADRLVYYPVDAEPLPITAVYSHLRKLTPAALSFVDCVTDTIESQRSL